MNLFMLCDYFYKQASLRSDMANRVMDSIIYNYKEDKYKPDIHSLELAASGAKKIIEYSAIAAIDEMKRHYKKDPKPLIPFDNGTNVPAVTKENITEFAKLYDILSKLFFDINNWDHLFGSNPWGKITKILYDLCIHYNQYLHTDKSDLGPLPKPDPKNPDYKPPTPIPGTGYIKILREIIVDMNLFDHMSHNNGSIYTKLSLIEKSKRNSDESDLERIQRLMHAKELGKVTDVYHETEDSLDTKLPFKDYITKIRNDPEYFNYNPENVSGQIKRIKVKKNTTATLSVILDTISNFRKVLPNNISKLNNPQLNINDINEAIEASKITIESLLLSLTEIDPIVKTYNEKGYTEFLQYKDLLQSLDSNFTAIKFFANKLAKEKTKTNISSFTRVAGLLTINANNMVEKTNNILIICNEAVQGILKFQA